LPDDFGLVDDQAGRHTIVSGHEAVAIGGTSMHGMTLAGFLELATSEPIGENRPLILGDRALDLQQKLIVGIVGDRMKQEDYLAPGPPELLEQQNLIGIFSSQAVRAVHRDDIDIRIVNRITQTIKGGPIEAGAAVSLVAEDIG
jgi:hypothetical protein